MYLRKTKSRGKEYYQICEVQNGKVKVVQHLGSLPMILRKFQYIKILEEDVSELNMRIAQYVKLGTTLYKGVGKELKNE